jgi:enoyl-CoA hydratase/carnithine racemase
VVNAFEDTNSIDEVCNELLIEMDQAVATVTINRPDRLNAMTPALQKRLLAKLSALDRSPDVRAIVLTGAARAFCAGADLSILDGVEDLVGTDALQAEAPTLQTPMIAAVNGPAIGIGFSIMLFADVIFMAAGVRVAGMFPRLGLVAEWGSAWQLQRRVGLGAATDILLSGRFVDAEEALALGLAQRVVPGTEVVSAARAWAADVAANCSPFAVSTIKRQIATATTQNFTDAFDLSVSLEETSFSRPDLAEAIAARAEQRAARFPAYSRG